MDNLVIEIGTAEELVKILRRCGTRGDPELYPYERSHIAIEPVNIDELVPLAKYVLLERLRNLSVLHRKLLDKDLDIFDLSSRMAWRDDGTKRFIAPPIVEYWEEEGFLLVDGLHRAWLARQQGQSTLTCAVIRKVPMPLVPLPTTWAKIKTYPPGEMPKKEEKHDFRFPDASSLRDAVPEISAQVTDENCQYFLFRDLSEVGSSGVRVVPSNNANRRI